MKAITQNSVAVSNREGYGSLMRRWFSRRGKAVVILLLCQWLFANTAHAGYRASTLKASGNAATKNARRHAMSRAEEVSCQRSGSSGRYWGPRILVPFPSEAEAARRR